jgi:HSP20 family protein
MSLRPKTAPHGIRPYKPFAFPLFGFRNELENLFERFLGHPFLGNPMVPFAHNFGTGSVWDFDITENAKEYVIKAELPGFEPRELDVELNENLLTIKAEKEETTEEECGCYNFYRTLTLPFVVEPAKLRACYRNGVLWVYLPKPEGPKGKHIPIKTE